MTDKLLDTDSEATVRLSVSEAQALGEQALRKVGFTREEAATIATHLVDASLWGYEFAGLPRIPVIAERPELKKPRTPLAIIKESPVSALLDGGNNVGYINILRAAEIAIDKAQQVRHRHRRWKKRLVQRPQCILPGENRARRVRCNLHREQHAHGEISARRQTQGPRHQSHGHCAAGKGEPVHFRHGHGCRDVRRINDEGLSGRGVFRSCRDRQRQDRRRASPAN